MKIVASNSLTLSKVNDGTITHTAYANIKFLCKENSNFTLSGVSLVRYGSDSRWVYKEFQAGTYTATTTLWGSDPASGTQKNVELVSNFSNSNSINTTHIGVYVDFVESDSVDPSKYNWTLVKGADGIGIKTTVITYANSTSGTTAPTTGWTSSVPSLVKGQYLWTKTVWTYTDNSSNIGYSVSYTSKDGNNGTDGTSGIIVSSVAPDSPQTGQLWQDTSTTPQLVKKWTGSEWVIWELYVENMNVNNLSALSPNLGDITGGSYTSWSVDADPGGTPILNGVYLYNGRVRSVSITNPTSIDPKEVGGIVNSSIAGTEMFGGYTDYYYGEYNLVNGTAEDMIKGINAMSFWSQQNDTGAYKGQITAENVTLSSWQNLILKSGFTTGDGVQPQYRRIKNLDGSYLVQFRGAVSPTSGNFPTSQVQVASLSGNYIPQTHTFVQGSDNTGRGGRVAALSDGRLMILAPNNSSYMYLNTLTYIN